MMDVKKVAAAAALLGLVASGGPALAQSSGTDQADQHGHSAQPQSPAPGQAMETMPGQGMGMMPGMMDMMRAMMHGQGQGMMGMGTGDEGPASMAFRGINAKMHRDMAIAYTGNVDVDFVKGMIAHHQGAIDMSKVVLAFGEDAEIKKLAQDIIKAQEGEIAWMKEWLAKRGQ